MNNLSIKINLSKLAGASFTKLTGRSGALKECVVIPVEDANLFVGEKGVYLDLSAFEYREPKFDNTHFVKQNLPKDVYANMSEQERNAQPIIGSIRTFTAPRMQASSEFQQQEDDLPF